MELHKRLSVSEQELDRLRGLKASEVRAWISGKNLFKGYPTAYKEAQEALIYGKINPKRSRRKAK